MPAPSFNKPLERMLQDQNITYKYYDSKKETFDDQKVSRICELVLPGISGNNYNDRIILMVFSIRDQSGTLKIHSEGAERMDAGSTIPSRNKAIELANQNNCKYMSIALVGDNVELAWGHVMNDYVVSIESFDYGNETGLSIEEYVEELDRLGRPDFLRKEVRYKGKVYSFAFVKKTYFATYAKLFDSRPYGQKACNYDVCCENEPITQADAEEDIMEEMFPKRAPRELKIHPLNCIIYGAPGTGKTYATAEYARAIIEGITLKDFQEQNPDRKVVMERYNKLVEDKQIVFTTFHQSYGYEDFIQGLRPDTKAENMSFKTVDGVFKQIADRALGDKENNYVIIIDEINRANISKVFGELITLIEDDKRWGEINQMSATLQSGDLFTVPNNLYIVGTMNSADKSISLIDAALRRRFEFIEQKPDASLVVDPTLQDVMKKLNSALASKLDSADLLIGHSFFMNRTEADLPKILNNNIIPLLYEYFYDNKKKVISVLESAIENVEYGVADDDMGRIFIERK